MILNGIDKIRPEDGKYLVLVDNGSEGLSVHGHFNSPHAACDAMTRSPYASWALVRIVDLTIEDRNA
jgi:hypothetical protein